MHIYRSKSSTFVKIATVSVLFLLSIAILSLVATGKEYSVITGFTLGMIITGTVIFFYANALHEIILDADGIVLKKNIGHVKILKSEILDIQKLAYSNLTMTYGSKGVFGFIGNTMDDSVSLVKDRKHMLKITTKDKTYILSSEKSDELVDKMKTLYR